MDGSYLESLSGLSRVFYKVVPAPIAQALEAYRRRRHYDVIVSWDDRIALIYAFLLMLTRSRSRHVAVVSWMAPRRKAGILRLVQKHIDRIIVWSRTHKDLLIEFSGISSSRVTEIPYFVDQKFWRPTGAPNEIICSAGDSKRDYATLIEAMRDLPIRCRIATNVKPSKQRTGDWAATSTAIAAVPDLPGNVVLAPASFVDLRDIYAASFCVVVPLLPSFRDHGVTTVVEAMAMGKAVICSHIKGQDDFIEDGINGIFVRPSDPKSLQAAITYLYEHPEVADRMGTEGRKRAEEIFALDHFVANVRQIVDDVISGNRTYISTADEKLCSPRISAVGEQ
jgi:glycosyltransferase involved in cell wall biosynthesis